MTKPIKLSRKQIQEGLDQVPMDTLILGTAAKHAGARLTPKQREFARLVALGESKAQSYRKAYNSKGKSKTAAQEGWKLSTRPDIAQMTEAFAQAKQFAESHTPAQLRAFVVQQLTQHASNEDNPPAVRLRALELIGKHAEVGSFLDRKEIVTIKQSGDLRERIAEKLKLIGAGSTIEHNAQQDDEQDAESLLNEINQTHTIDSGAIISDEDIAEHEGKTGFSHADDILEATGFDAQEAGPTPTGTPLNRGVIVAEATHIIPHTQTVSDSIPHNQSSSFADAHTQSLPELSPHDQTSSFSDQPIPLHDNPKYDSDVAFDSIDLSTIADEGPSAEAGTGLEVDNGRMSP